MTSADVRSDEKVLLERARELLGRPRPKFDDRWETLEHIGALKFFVAELAAALELRRETELP